MIEAADAAPTQSMLDVYSDLDQRLNKALAQWDKSEGSALTQMNVPLIVISR